MVLRLNGNVAIENLRHYPLETVEKLRVLLSAGAPAVPDTNRRNFYDVGNGSRKYYIHISPSGKVLLLATWLEESAEALAPVQALVAEPCACGG